jgi:hypothetical protein
VQEVLGVLVVERKFIAGHLAAVETRLQQLLVKETMEVVQ